MNKETDNESSRDWNDVDKSFSEDKESKEDKAIAELESQLNKEKDARREDQFVFIFVCVILLDVVFFTVIDGLAAIALVVMELLILFPLARRMGMEEFAGILSRVLGRVSDGVKGE